MKSDNISRIICEELDIRAYTVESLNTVREITRIHGTTPNATAALGRTINATALLSASLKPDSHQNITVKFSGSGPVEEIHVQADAQGNIRGYVENPQVDILEDIGEISFSRTIGAGFLTVTKDIGMKEMYNSVLPLMKGEVASDIACYLTTSEQVPSAVIIGLNLDKQGGISSSGGILIQTLPETEDSVIEMIENNIMSRPYALADALEDGADILSFLSELLDNNPLKLLQTSPISHSCRCSREIISSTIKQIQESDLKDMIENDRGAEVKCSFCKKEYKFSEDDLRKLLHSV